MSERPFMTARAAAERLGCSEAAVIHDIEEGMDGALPALVGAYADGLCVVSAWELEGPRLEMHGARLGELQGESSAVCNTVTSSAVQ